MSVVPIFPGEVRHGVATPYQPVDFGKWVRSLEGQQIELIVRKRGAGRSLQQNALLWMWITMIADDKGYDKHEREQVHYELLAIRFGTVTLKHGLVMPAKTTHDMTTAEMAEYLDWLQRYAATDLDMQLPSPGEADYPDEAA